MKKRTSRLFCTCGFTALVFLLLITGCSKEHPSQPFGNQSPQSYIALYPFDDSTQPSFAKTTSRQHLHWWGEDPDGWIIGYLFSFDGSHWYWTTKNDSIFALTIYGTDTTYTFLVSSVDNSLSRYGLITTSDSGPITWTPGTIHPRFGDALDPTPASVRIPIKNTPPEVRFEMVGDVFGTPLTVPETTFTVVSFQWVGTDLDGNNTIAKYSIALNDTTPRSWLDLPGIVNFVTLKARKPAQGQTVVDADVYANVIPQLPQAPLPTPIHNFKLNSENVLYLRAEDVSGAKSAIARMPAEGKHWYVKQPKGDLLIIDDYSVTDNSTQFYSSIFDTLGMSHFAGAYDVWDIKTGSRFPQKGKYVPTWINPTFTETLKLFKYIFWYTSDEQDFDVAQRSLPEFRKGGGKVLFSFNLPKSYSSGIIVNQALKDFSGVVDSLGADIIPTTSTGFVLPRTQVVPDSLGGEGYPLLVRDDFTSNPVDGGKVVANLRELYPSVGSVILYRLQPSSTGAYPGMPVLGVKDAQNSFILIGIPLYRFNGGDKNVGAFFNRAFKDLGAY